MINYSYATFDILRRNARGSEFVGLGSRPDDTADHFTGDAADRCWFGNVSLTSLSAFIIALFISWLKYERDILPLRSMSLIVHYAVERLPLYRKIMSREFGAQWTRTARKKLP